MTDFAVPIPGETQNWGDDLNNHLANALDPTSGFIKTGAVMASDSAPVEDAGVANKLYVDNQVATKEATVVTQATAGIFGAWTDKDSDNSTLVKTVSYTTQCDGFITAYTDYGGTLVYIETPIGTIRTGGIGGQGYAGWLSGVCCPVRKGDTWKVMGANHIYWLPFGTGGLVKQ